MLMAIEYDWDAWKKAARAEADEHRKVHGEDHFAKGDPRCPECVRGRDRHVAAVLARTEPAEEDDGP